MLLPPPLISLIGYLLLLLLSLYGVPLSLPTPYINTLIAQVSRGFARFADTYKSYKDVCVCVCAHTDTHIHNALGFTGIHFS